MAINTRGRGIYKIKNGKVLFYLLKQKALEKRMPFVKYLKSVGLTHGSVYGRKDGSIKEIEKDTFEILKRELGEEIKNFIS